MKFKIVTAGLLLTLSATLLTACGSSASSSKDTSSSKRQSETVSQSKAKSAFKVKVASESKAKESSSDTASSKAVARSSAKASSESQATSSSAAKVNPVHYTDQQLAIICQVFGQDGANMGISTILDSMSNSTIHYFADTTSTGHNSLGTGASYEQYQLSGDQPTITHPAAQGTAAWTKTFSLSQSASAIFSTANTTLVNGITSKMVQEN